MARALHANTIAELTKANVKIALLVEFDFPAGFIRYWTGFGTLAWSGNNYTGQGNLLGASFADETEEVRATGAAFTLTGLRSDNVNLTEALTTEYQNRAAKAWLAFFNASDAIISDPVLIFEGRMDNMEIEESGETTTITMRCENILVDLERARDRRYTPEDQKIDYPTDKGLDFVPTIQNRELRWPR